MLQFYSGSWSVNLGRWPLGNTVHTCILNYQVAAGELELTANTRVFMLMAAHINLTVDCACQGHNNAGQGSAYWQGLSSLTLGSIHGPNHGLLCF